MSYRRSPNDSPKLWIRSAIIVVLIVLSYGLERQAETDAIVVGSMSGAVSDVSPSLDLSVPPSETDRSHERLEPGDIVFRARNDWLAQLAKRFGSAATYSHVGVITTQNNQLWVVHTPIVSGPGMRQRDRISETTLADYLTQDDSSQAAVYRLKAATDDIQSAIAAAALEYAAQKRADDNNMFRLTTREQTDCSTLIRNIYTAAQVNWTAPIQTPLGAGAARASSPAHQQTHRPAEQPSDRTAITSQLESLFIEETCLTPDSLSTHKQFRPVYPLESVRSVQSSLD